MQLKLSEFVVEQKKKVTVVSDRKMMNSIKLDWVGVACDSSLATLCARLINIEEDFDAGLTAARAHIRTCDESLGEVRLGWESKFLDRGGCNVDDLIVQLFTLAQDAGSVSPTMVLSPDETCFVLTQYASQALLSGCVLQNLANASNCHESISSFTHNIHSWHVGGGNYSSNHAVLYRHLLERLDVSLPSIGSSRFSDNAQMLPISWSLPAYRLSLSMFPRECQAEILGAALFELMVAIPAIVLKAVGDDIAGSKYGTALISPGRNQALDAAKAAIAATIGSEHAERDTARRVLKGFITSLELLNAWSNEVSRLIHDGYLVPAQAMIRLVRKKAKYAVGYHDRLKLANHSFEKLIVQDPERFVQQLSRSRWVSPGQPQVSLLLTRLIAFGGPMFRVFSDTEIEVISCWIRSLAETNDRQDAQPMVFADMAAQQLRISQSQCTVRTHNQRRCRSIDVRDMYHRLLNIDRYPEVRSEALDYANTWLERSASDSVRGDNALPFEKYAHEELRAWFEAKALAQAQSYGSNTDDIEKTRNEVIDEALQLCPMILIDGAWLQRWSNVGLVDGKIGALFYKIFSDEIGNGDPRLNHPNIYRDLMRQMDVDLPDFLTREFAYFERFTNNAFPVPVFWLSVSQFPRRFLPETLGLNLAMELSGVGGAYRTARDELQHHGFSTLFVDLHNTIDNVSSGHSAMAVEAIELYMDEFLNVCSPSLVATQWRRVWTGYNALSIPKRSWRELFSSPRYAV
jgi:Iron-containing redox enzyme